MEKTGEPVLDEMGSSFKKIIAPIITKYSHLVLNDDKGEFKEILVEFFSSILDEIHKQYKLEYRMNNLLKLQNELQPNLDRPQKAEKDSCQSNTLTPEPKQPSFQFKYYCVYCKDLDSAEYYPTVEQVYKHWQNVHENSKNESSLKPFRFTVGQMKRPKNYNVKLTDEMLATLREIDMDHITEECVEIVCGYDKCERIVRDNQFPSHFVEHFIPLQKVLAKNTRAEEPQCDPSILNEYYGRSRVIFENGLVLMKFNLLNTKENDFDRIEAHIATRSDLLPIINPNTAMIQMRKGEDPDAEYDNMSEEDKLIELEKQKKLMKKLWLLNLPSTDNHDLIQEIFLNRCKEIQVKVNADDIKRIYLQKSNRSAVIVELKDEKIRDEIFLAHSQSPSKSSASSPFQIRPYTTHMYRRMLSFVEAKSGILSYRITNEGFLVKHQKDEKEHLFLSFGDLKDFFRDVEKTDDKRGKRSHETVKAADGPALKLRCLDESTEDD